MPYRDPNDRIAKVGQGYSKMLKMIKPGDIGQSRFLAEESGLVKEAAAGGKNRMSETQNFHSVPQLPDLDQALNSDTEVNEVVMGKGSFLHNRSQGQLPKIGRRSQSKQNVKV